MQGCFLDWRNRMHSEISRLCPDVHLSFSQRLKCFLMVVLLLASHWRWRWKKQVLIRAQTKDNDDTTTSGTYGVRNQENSNLLAILKASSKESYLNLPGTKPFYTCLVHDGIHTEASRTTRGASRWYVGRYRVFDWREQQHYWCWHQLICNCFQRYVTQNFGERLPAIKRKLKSNKEWNWRIAWIQSWIDVLDETDWEPSIKFKLSRQNHCGVWKWFKTGYDCSR